MNSTGIKQVAIAFLLASPLCLAGSAEAQKVYRIASLVADDQFVPSIEGFKKKMTELGYVEGKNVKYDFHNAKGDRETLKRLVEKLVQGRPDLIVTSSTTATFPVAKATEGTYLPVVFLSAGNPLELVKSYASSDSNLTGITTASVDLTAKRMELLKELAPGIKRVISLNNPTGPNYKGHFTATQEAAKKLGLEIVEVNVTSGDEVKQRADVLITRKAGDALFLPPDAIVNAAISEISQRAIKEKLPSVASSHPNVKRGVLATYAADYFALGQQGAVLVDKILKGVRPRDLPIEQPAKLKLVINLKTAKAIGLKVPREILLRADEVIQ
ncbi:MAG: ABC transporter substrate-binding protein [Deltaproteobacteria bacterium]|nr:ABC transporter substrate-binding protein [Deltaproteobacteria bacterium]